MKIIKFASFFIALCTSQFSALGQTEVNSSLREKIKSINDKVSLAFINNDVEKIIDNYDKVALSMPEYQPIMKGTDAIREYYSEILTRRSISVHKKQTTDLINLNSRIAETGIFKTTYKNKSDDKLINLNGKYLTIWRIQKNGDIKIESEAFGYFKNLEDAPNHIVKISKDVVQPEKVLISQKEKNLDFLLKALNLLNAEAVKTRDGNLAADFFTNDGILMPFADSTKRGINVIRPRMIKYNSGAVTFDSIRVYNVGFVDCEKYVIEYSKFYVKWHIPSLSQIVTGKGIRVWRKEIDGTIKRLWEIGTHDYIVK